MLEVRPLRFETQQRKAREAVVCGCTQGFAQRRDAPVSNLNGGLAQLGEHLLCKQGVVGSIPSSSTIYDM